MSKTASLPRCPANPESLPFGPDKPWLAPLAGYSDLPFRLLCREYGAAVCVTEMVSAKGLVYQSPGTNDLLASCSARRRIFCAGPWPCCARRATAGSI